MNFRQGDIVSVKLQVKHFAKEGETLYLTVPGESYSTIAVLPEKVTLFYQAFKAGDRIVDTNWPEGMGNGVVIQMNEDMLWVKYDFAETGGQGLVDAGSCVHEDDWLAAREKKRVSNDPDYREVEEEAPPPAERPLIPRIPPTPPLAEPEPSPAPDTKEEYEF